MTEKQSFAFGNQDGILFEAHPRYFELDSEDKLEALYRIIEWAKIEKAHVLINNA